MKAKTIELVMKLWELQGDYNELKECEISEHTFIKRYKEKMENIDLLAIEKESE